ncbi:MAG: YihY/virulence factor BrkB family protein [Acidimicrobiales bacterium]
MEDEASPVVPAPASTESLSRAQAVEGALVSGAKTEASYFKRRVRDTNWGAVIASARQHMRTGRVNVAAQAFAYRWFLSIFPTIIALLGVATLVTIPRSVVIHLIHGVTRALPSGASEVFTKAITHATRRTSRDLIATVLASLVAIWSAVSGMVVVEQGLGVAYEVPVDRSFMRKRLVGAMLLVGAITLGGAASALVVFGAPIGKAIKDASPFSGDAFAGGWTALRWIIALILINLLFSLLYYLAPNRPGAKWQWTSAGALLATVVWAVVSLAFSAYTTDFSSYSKTYGAFAGVAILIFWLYLTGLAILVGGEINAAIERVALAPTQGSDAQRRGLTSDSNDSAPSRE